MKQYTVQCKVCDLYFPKDLAKKLVLVDEIKKKWVCIECQKVLEQFQ